MNNNEIKQQSKMPLAIAIGIPVGAIIGIIVSIIIKEDCSFGMTAGGILGLSISLLIGGILDIRAKKNRNHDNIPKTKY